MIHVYGIVDELSSLPPRRGVGNAPLERRRVGRLELVVSRAPDAAAREVTREAVLEHAGVVDELMSRSRAVLPVQFTSFADDEELAAAIRPKADALERGLSCVRGCVEFGLRVAGAERTEASSGAEYMRARLAEEKLVAGLHEPLARLARAATTARTSPASLLESAYLVPEGSVEAFRAEIDRIKAAHPEFAIVCTGPWPPYSFTVPEGEG